jgi:hypothetical protein
MSPYPLMDVYWFSDASFNTPSSEFSEKLVNIVLEGHKWEVLFLSCLLYKNIKVKMHKTNFACSFVWM